MVKVTVYTKNNCPQCSMTKMVLDGEGISYILINVEEDEDAMDYVRNTLQLYSMPVVIAEGSKPFTGFQPDKLKGLK